MSPVLEVSAGSPHPLGANVAPGGVNFSLFSSSATAVELLLFRSFDADAPMQVIALDPRRNRTFSYWHVFVHGVGEGLVYAYRCDGPDDPERGLCFDADKLLLDPYARGIVYGPSVSRVDAISRGSNVATAMKSLVVDPSRFDWQGVEPPRIPAAERVIYELHVRGFTRHPSSQTRHPGSFQALVEKVPYLRELGVTTVELMPVFQFDPHSLPFRDPTTGAELTDYWGYNPLGFFAPHRGYYEEDWHRMRYLTGFRDMVREFHRAGIEVVLDVVFNHTGEGGIDGPTQCFRGIDNPVYYLLEREPGRAAKYLDYSGTGNTFNCNHPIARRMVLDALRYWAGTMRVDGFRFDLATILARDVHGRPMADPPLPWEIESDPVLQNALLVAEAWDAGGLYQVGHFPGERWSEWNGIFRDDVRRFVRGDLGLAPALAKRMLGSPDLYEHRGHEPHQCINFVTCHDGFTLRDLVSYEHKHNLRNGEQGRDGTDANYSANYGVEGESADPTITAVRLRQSKNLLAILLLSQGTPMLLAGDEFGRSQGGNNNAYCQDNPTSWCDWGGLQREAELHRFTRELIAFRRRHPSLRRTRYLQGDDGDVPSDGAGTTRVRWHGVEPDRPDWSFGCRTLAFTLVAHDDDDPLHVIINAHDDAVRFRLPSPGGSRRWRVAIDTARPSPEDIVDTSRHCAIAPAVLQLAARSVVVLVGC
ncbi:MAG: glycogen debranching protein GlgX [Deltaproteobacteria bacterium]|nr:glycogen debranching protein GlgX [Deltaproteobacteria bacterium]